MSAIKKLPSLAQWSTVSLERMPHQKSEDMHRLQKLIYIKSVKISCALFYLHSILISLISYCVEDSYCTQEASHHLVSQTLPGALEDNCHAQFGTVYVFSLSTVVGAQEEDFLLTVPVMVI